MNYSKSVVYVADDDADDRYFIREAIQGVDPSVTIVEAKDGADLLALLHSRTKEPTPQSVNLILLDMNMPKMNGLEALVAIKADPALRHIPTVMISTCIHPGQVAAAYQYGINSYIQKPTSSFDLGQVAHALKVCFLDAVVG
ncbi:MAG: response regulator [Rudanella sp.]|nr:response regulator [Rudanella sp.]